jgi:hypothetical protein
MLSVDLTTYRDILLKYFGTDDYVACAELTEERLVADKALAGISDLTCDTSLFPYEAQGPFETPLPTMAEIATKITNSDGSVRNVGTVRIGPYMVKFGTEIRTMQVGYPS